MKEGEITKKPEEFQNDDIPSGSNFELLRFQTEYADTYTIVIYQESESAVNYEFLAISYVYEPAN